MCGFADFRKDFSGFFRIFGKVYEDFWSDTPLVSNHNVFQTSLSIDRAVLLLLIFAAMLMLPHRVQPCTHANSTLFLIHY